MYLTLGQQYFAVTAMKDIVILTCIGDSIDYKNIKIGNVFNSYLEAKDNITKIVLRLKEDVNNG